MFSTSVTSPIATGSTLPRPARKSAARRTVAVTAKKETEQRKAEHGPGMVSQLVGAVAAASLALTPMSMANPITDTIASPAAREAINERTTDLPSFGEVGQSLKDNLAGIRADPEGAAESIRGNGLPGKIVSDIGKNIEERKSDLPSPSDAGKVGQKIQDALPSNPLKGFGSLLPSTGDAKRAVDNATPDLPSAGDVGKSIQDAVPSNPLKGFSNPLKGNTPDLPSPSEAKSAVDNVKSDLPSAGDVGSAIKDALPSNPLKGFSNPLKGNTPDLPSASDAASAVKDNAPDLSSAKDIGKNLPSAGDIGSELKNKLPNAPSVPNPTKGGLVKGRGMPRNVGLDLGNKAKDFAEDLANKVDSNTPDLKDLGKNIEPNFKPNLSPNVGDLGKNIPNLSQGGKQLQKNLPDLSGGAEKGSGLQRNIGFNLGSKAKDLADKVDRNTPDLPSAKDIGKNLPSAGQAKSELKKNLPNLPSGAEKGSGLQRNVNFPLAFFENLGLKSKVQQATPSLSGAKEAAKDIGKNLPSPAGAAKELKKNLPDLPSGAEKGSGLQRNVALDLGSKAKDLADKVDRNTPDLPSIKDIGKNLPSAGQAKSEVEKNLPNLPSGAEKGSGLQRNVDYQFSPKDAPQPDQSDLADKMGRKVPDPTASDDLGKAFGEKASKLAPGETLSKGKEVAGDVVEKLKSFLGDSN